MSDPDGHSSNGSTDSSNDSLNGSWVKLDASDKNGSSEHPISAHNGKMEDLLAEAVADESRGSSGTHSDRKGPSTPSNEISSTETKSETKVLPPEHNSSDPSWIEDWSSRVEQHPPKKWQLTYPPRKDQRSCVRKMQSDKSDDGNETDNMMKLNFYIVIPTLLITHVIAFGIGLYLGRRTSSGSTPV